MWKRILEATVKLERCLLTEKATTRNNIEYPFLAHWSNRRILGKMDLQACSLTVPYFAEARRLADGDWPCWSRLCEERIELHICNIYLHFKSVLSTSITNICMLVHRMGSLSSYWWKEMHLIFERATQQSSKCPWCLPPASVESHILITFARFYWSKSSSSMSLGTLTLVLLSM